MPLLIMLSMTGTASLYAATASSLLPASQAATTILTLVRNIERMPMLALRVFSAWRARLRADLMFATRFFRVLLSKEPRIIRARRADVNEIRTPRQAAQQCHLNAGFANFSGVNSEPR